MAEMKTITINGKKYNVEDSDSVSYGESQQLTEEQKARARKNIGAAFDDAFVKTVNGHAPDENGKVNIIDDTQMGADAWSGRKIAVDKASAIVEQASGEQLSLNDSAEAPLAGLALYGKTTQRTTTGKNIHDYLGVVSATSGLTVADGVVTGAAWQVVKAQFKVPPALVGKTLSCRVKVKSTGNDGAACYIRCYNWDKATEVGGNLVPANAGYYQTATLTCVPENANCTIEVCFASMPGYSNTSSSNQQVWAKDFQIEVGEAVTDYEPYTGGKPSPSPDYPQELVSVGDTGSIEVTVAGKNLFDGMFPHKYRLSGTGDNRTVVEENGHSSAVMPVMPNIAYVFSGDFSGIPDQILRYAIFEELPQSGSVSVKYGHTSNSNVVTVPDNGHYLLLWLANTNVQEAAIQVEIGAAATAYAPYKGQTVTVSTPNGLPGIPVTSGGNYTDETGRQWICDEIDFVRGVLVKRITTVDLGSLTWNYNQSTGRFASSKLSPVSKLKAAGVSTHLSVVNKDYRNLLEKEMVVFDKAFSSSSICIVRCDGITDSAVFQEKMRGATLLYELEQPIETALSGETIAAFRALHTNYPNTTVLNNAGAGVQLSYVVDTKTYIDNKFAELAAAMMNS